MRKFFGYSKRVIACALSAMLLVTAVPNSDLFKGTANYVQAEEPDDPVDNPDEPDPVKVGSDPYEEIKFADLYNDDQLETSDDASGVKYKVQNNGILVSGKKAKFNDGFIKIKDQYDFGSGCATRIRLDALAKRAAKIKVKFYLNDETEPFATQQLKFQTEKDNWTASIPVFAELPADTVKGQGIITVRFEDETTADDKKTEMLIRSIKFYKESVPTVYIHIDEDYTTIGEMNSDPEHKTECYGYMDIKVPLNEEGEPIFGYPDNTGKITYKGGTNYTFDYIRGRGNSTWGVEKKPYKIKLDNKADLFGMGENKHWTLIANYYDNSLVRNRLTYYLGQELEMMFTPQLVPVDVVMNDKYLGGYYLCEQVRVGESRVEIQDLEKITDSELDSDEDAITGGYLLGVSPYEDDEGYRINTSHGVEMLVESPEELENASAERINDMNAYIDDYVNKTENAIFSENFTDDEGHYYTEYMDLDSAAKYFLIQEFSANGDAYWTTSTHLYKDKGGKLCWGPLWDFDYVAWASYNYQDYDSTRKPPETTPRC